VANQPGAFLKFQSHVRAFISQTRTTVGDPQNLGRLLESLAGIVEAKRGSKGLPRLADWTWLETAVEQQRRKSLVKFVGVNEQVERTERYWHPYWLGDLSYSQSEGTVFKSGTSKHGFLLVDATSARLAPGLLVEGSSIFRRIESAARSEVVDGRLTLPPLINEATAQRVLEGYARSNPDFCNPLIKVRRIVYLPAAQVVYQSRQGARPFTISALGAINGDTGNLRQATFDFARQYAS
jgi:hypothetical protein